MPAYDKPIVINSTAPASRKVAATIRFSSTDDARIADWLERLLKAGVIENFEVRGYDPRETSPTLYFP